MGNLTSARALGNVRDATGREGVGVELPLRAGRSRLQVIIGPKTSEILQSSEVMDSPPTEAPRLESGRRMAPWLA